MIPSGYFDRSDSPAKNSPVGKLMQKMHAEFPDLEVEASRIEAREALLGVGGATRIQDAYKHWLKARSRVSTTRKARSYSLDKVSPLVAPTHTLAAPLNAISTQEVL